MSGAALIPTELKIKLVVTKLWLIATVLKTVSLLGVAGCLLLPARPLVDVDPRWFLSILLAIWVVWLVGRPVIEWVFDFSRLEPKERTHRDDFVATEENRGLTITIIAAAVFGVAVIGFLVLSATTS